METTPCTTDCPAVVTAALTDSHLKANRTPWCACSSGSLTATGGHMQPTQRTPLVHLAVVTREGYTTEPQKTSPTHA